MRPDDEWPTFAEVGLVLIVLAWIMFVAFKVLV